MAASIPRATYRVQLNHEFTFADATRIVAYLAELGISHLYTSPLLKARPGSMHGYDVTDHTQLNPELGTQDDFEQLIATLHSHGMGLLVDIVPNHLGIMGSDNQWWLDVLENGPAAQFAGYFDIDWRPNRASLRDRLLVPVLGDPYGTVLERGEIQLHFDAARGEFSLRYHEHCFPIDPREYPRIFNNQGAPPLDELSAADLESLLNSLGRLPPRNVVTEASRVERYRDKEVHKRRLVRLIERDPAVLTWIDTVIAAINGVVGDPGSFDALDALHEAQAYRLAYWRVAADEVNYRRFFDVNSLAALRMNDPEVFSATHALIAGLIAAGSIDGLRIDHSDGLYDPERYFQELRRCVAQADPADRPFYIVTEKILAQHERLPETWPIQGTTGYEFAALATGWLVDAAGERTLSRTYRHFVERVQTFDDIAWQSRKLVMRISLAPEVEGLATQLDRLAQLDRHTADFTRPALREAIMEVIACFPVYRTYISERGVTEEDQRIVDRAVRIARKRSLASDVSVFDFLREVLLVGSGREVAAPRRAAMLEFAMKFQQVTAPVTAKGVEDTALYRFNRLVCLNEVGSDPRRFGVSTQAVHQENAERARRWRDSMLATSTHDTKRSEDVRARIAVLSELPDLWKQHLARWSRLNRGKRVQANDATAPDRDDEYLIYQTLLGIWQPGTPVPEQIDRLQAYIVKAAREAKRATSWLNPDSEYENALGAFVASLLDTPRQSAFLHDFAKLSELTSYFGHLNSLAQIVLKLASPGVPDIYQGNEASVFALVDPDNRQPANFDEAARGLDMLQQRLRDEPRMKLVEDLLAQGYDGSGKLYVTLMLLTLRRERPQLFALGSYTALTVSGEYKEHVLAFSRTHESQRVIVIVSRWACRLMKAVRAPPVGDVWGDTRIELDVGSNNEPDIGVGRQWPAEALTELFSGRAVEIEAERRCIRVVDAFASLPFAVLMTGQ